MKINYYKLFLSLTLLICISCTKKKIPKKFSGKKLVTYGHSIIEQNRWQPKVVTDNGFTHINLGVGSTQVTGNENHSISSNERINEIPLDTDYLIVMFLMNDWTHSEKLGTPSDTNTSTIYGASKIMIERLALRLPNTEIILMSETFASAISRFPTTPFINNQGMSTSDLTDFVKEIGNKYGLQIIDMSLCGWNENNISEYVDKEKDGSFIHPNRTFGADRMSYIVNNFFNSIKP